MARDETDGDALAGALMLERSLAGEGVGAWGLQKALPLTVATSESDVNGVAVFEPPAKAMTEPGGGVRRYGAQNGATTSSVCCVGVAASDGAPVGVTVEHDVGVGVTAAALGVATGDGTCDTRNTPPASVGKKMAPVLTANPD